MFKAKALMALGTLASVASLGVASCFAATDADVQAAATTVASTTVENIKGVITTNLPSIVIVGVILLAVGLSWKLIRRFMGGK